MGGGGLGGQQGEFWPCRHAEPRPPHSPGPILPAQPPAANAPLPSPFSCKPGGFFGVTEKFVSFYFSDKKKVSTRWLNITVGTETFSTATTTIQRYTSTGPSGKRSYNPSAGLLHLHSRPLSMNCHQTGKPRTRRASHHPSHHPSPTAGLAAHPHLLSPAQWSITHTAVPLSPGQRRLLDVYAPSRRCLFRKGGPSLLHWGAWKLKPRPWALHNRSLHYPAAPRTKTFPSHQRAWFSESLQSRENTQRW